MLSVSDVAKLLNISAKKVYRLIDQDKIPTYKVDEEYHFNRIDVVEWATSIGIKVTGDTFRNNPDSDLPCIIDTLRAGNITYGIDGHDKMTVLRNVVNSIELPQSINRDVIYEVLVAREKLGSTGIGDGIAIPHVRNPVVLNVKKPVIALSFLKHPIEFDSMDKLPVNILFTIISPAVRIHLHLLSRLSFVLQNTAFKSVLKSQAAPDVLLKSLSEVEAVFPSQVSFMMGRNHEPG